MSVTFNTPGELWDALALKEGEPWVDFKKRLLQNNGKGLVYEYEGRKMLNSIPSRGFKHWLFVEGKLSKARWDTILNYFTPIVHKEKSKYASEASDDDNPNDGFTLLNISNTLECPAFLGDASDENCKKLVSGLPSPGEHVYRFSSQKGNFVMHLKGNDQQVNAYKIYPEDSKKKLFLAFNKVREDFKTLAELESSLPQWKEKFGIPFIAKSTDEYAYLDQGEKQLLDWLEKHKAKHLYPKIILELKYKNQLSEDLEGFKLLRKDPTFHLTAEEKASIDNAFNEEEDEGENKPKTGGKAKAVTKKPQKRKEKVLV